MSQNFSKSHYSPHDTKTLLLQTVLQKIVKNFSSPAADISQKKPRDLAPRSYAIHARPVLSHGGTGPRLHTRIVETRGQKPLHVTRASVVAALPFFAPDHRRPTSVEFKICNSPRGMRNACPGRPPEKQHLGPRFLPNV